MAWDTVSTDKAAVLWLWRAHNRVNKRLEGSATEDPKWPKVQFPPPGMCGECWQNGNLSSEGVLQFLLKFYAAGAQWTGNEWPPSPPSSPRNWLKIVMFIACAVA